MEEDDNSDDTPRRTFIFPEECGNFTLEGCDCISKDAPANNSYPLADPPYNNIHPDIKDRAFNDIQNMLSGLQRGGVPLGRANTLSLNKTAQRATIVPKKPSTYNFRPRNPTLLAIQKEVQKKHPVAYGSTTACHFNQKLFWAIDILQRLGYDYSINKQLMDILTDDVGTTFFSPRPDAFQGYKDSGQTPAAFAMRNVDPNDREKIARIMKFLSDIQFGRNIELYIDESETNDITIKILNDLKSDPDLVIPFVLTHKYQDNGEKISVDHWANIVFKGYVCVGPFSEFGDNNCYKMPIYGIRTAWGQGESGRGKRDGFYFEPTSNHMTAFELIRLFCYLRKMKGYGQTPFDINNLFVKAFFRIESAKGITACGYDLFKSVKKKNGNDVTQKVVEVIKESQNKVVRNASNWSSENLWKEKIDFLMLPGSGALPESHVFPDLQLLFNQPFVIKNPAIAAGGSSKRKSNKRRKSNKTRKTNKRNSNKRRTKRRI